MSILAALATGLPQVTSPLAYIGPGAGLSAIGAFLAVVLAVIVALIGFVWYPLRRFLRSRRQADADASNPATHADEGDRDS